MSRIVIAGGSGFLGRSLAHELSKRGHEPSLLARTKAGEGEPWRRIPWDGRNLGDWQSELEGAAALVNLAGHSVDCIKTPENRDRILRSRVESTRVLGEALTASSKPPPLWVQMSTAHIYGDPPQALCDEGSATGEGLAPFVARSWEKAFHAAAPSRTRKVILRTSFVLGREGGALVKLVRLARWGLGGRVGHGRQGISWIHEEDMNALFLRAIEDSEMNGLYLATAPHPVSNADFMRALRLALGRPIGLPAPAFLVRIGAPLLFRTDPELALQGRYCVSKRLEEEGFEFKHPEVGEAFRSLYGR